MPEKFHKGIKRQELAADDTPVSTADVKNGSLLSHPHMLSRHAQGQI